MAKSRLHEVAELGQSVWIDSLSRGWLKTGALAGWMDEDALTGVTSNPTIFQKAMSEGEWYDDQLREVIKQEDDLKEVFLQLAMVDIEEACDLFRSVWDGGKGKDGYISMEVDPNLAYDTDGDDRGGGALPRLGRAAEPLREDPGDRARAACDRGDDRAWAEHQRDADLRPRAPHGSGRGIHPRPRAARRGRRRPGEGRLGRELLRLARGHGGRPTARRGGAPGAEGEARGREREARLPELRGEVLRRALGGRSPRRARPRSGACGPRRRRRIRSTATCSTSRS